MPNALILAAMYGHIYAILLAHHAISIMVNPWYSHLLVYSLPMEHFLMVIAADFRLR
jgi:hypothetical protein